MRTRFAPLAITLTAALALSACGGGASTSPTATQAADSRPRVVAAFAPLAEVARATGGDAVNVTELTPPGVEPHDLELSATQVADISAADLVLYVKGFQPAVDEAVAQHAADRAIDVSEGLTLRTDGGAQDPHVWLDPRNMATIADGVAARLTSSIDDADAQAAIAANSEAFDASMQSLDADFRKGLASCRTKTMVVSHDAFGYLADAYGLTQIGIAGLSPEAEPSPARLAEVADIVRSNGVKTVYSETLVDPKVAQTLADEAGVATAVLDPIEGIPAGSSYDSIMRANLAALVEGQGCR